MRAERISETAVLVRDLESSAPAVAASAERLGLPGFVEAVAVYDTVGLYFDRPVDPSIVVSRLSSVPISETASRRHVIPVCYAVGPDLEAVAERLGLSSHEVAQLHCSKPYTAQAIGFSPGFAYLGELPDALQGLPRLPSPRPRVEAGMVGMIGAQTAVYPSATPGGWNLIGRSPLTLVDLESGYFPIKVGDVVQFESIDFDSFDRLKGKRL